MERFPCNQPGCGAELTTAFNLKRHKERIHGVLPDDFINYTASSPSADEATSHSVRAVSEHTSIQRMVDPPAAAIPMHLARLPMCAPFYRSPSSGATSTTADNDLPEIPSLSYAPSTPRDPSRSLSPAPTRVDGLSLALTSSRRKRRRSLLMEDDHHGLTLGRVMRARLAPPVPTYEVKQSQRTPGQQRAIAWLTQAAKEDFAHVYETLVARWGGLTPAHNGSCVLCTEDWRSLTPSDLLTHVTKPEGLPSRRSTRLQYQYSDHDTQFTRAAAWFRGSPWPKTGVSLDVFLDCDGFAPMDVSHLYHQDHCLVHLAYEAAHINDDRKICAAEARKARQDGLDIHKTCSKHDPPCLLKHAALVTSEVYLIQFDVLRQATGLHLALATDRPQHHLYPTFETRLPLSWDPTQIAVNASVKNFASKVPPPQRLSRPQLLCAFYSRVKGYGTVIGYWSHLVNNHQEVNVSERLPEIKRTATL
ncbi:MAG: hypothetical protein Q9174_004382 [Haloplaca sp. 1 TL-2023]